MDWKDSENVIWCCPDRLIAFRMGWNGLFWAYRFAHKLTSWIPLAVFLVFQPKVQQNLLISALFYHIQKVHEESYLWAIYIMCVFLTIQNLQQYFLNTKNACFWKLNPVWVKSRTGRKMENSFFMNTIQSKAFYELWYVILTCTFVANFENFQNFPKNEWFRSPVFRRVHLY